ncbi:MAG: glycosyltransferase [Lutibacter sp.]|nr:glycosyltransferase [Lutibacter sp.]
MSINSPLVSVILPVYGNCDYLKHSIRSILNQSVQDFEVIIILDNILITEDFIIRNGLNDSRIKLLYGNGNGLSSALNLGIQNSTGRYLARIDSDDISELNRFELQIEYLKNNNLDACGSFIKYFGSSNYTRIFPVSHNEIVFLMQFGTQVAHPSAMFRSNFFDVIKYNEKYKQVEDLELWISAILSGKLIGNVPQYLLKYRTHVNQASNKAKSEQNKIASNLTHELSLKYFGDKYIKLFSKYNFGYNESMNAEDAFDFMNLYLKCANEICLDNNINNLYFLSILSRIKFKNIFYIFKFRDLAKSSNLKISIVQISFFYINNLLPKYFSIKLVNTLKNIYK